MLAALSVKTAKTLSWPTSLITSNFSEIYSTVCLKKCKTKESQTWRHASGSKAANRLALFYDFFPELSSLKNSLTSYSICESHYNQIITTDQLYNSFLEQDKEYDNSMNVDEIQINSEYEQNMLYTSNLTIQIKKLQQELNELSYKYQMLEESNKILIDKLNKKFDTHEKRVEIALAE
ncbi:15456_t:CDS:2, partial [Entrophospora sp. SA101]